jgi:mevalonate pyrophosphate decarboxylase
MARLSDHDRRDAEHAARAKIAVSLQRFRRRMDELAKAHIAEQMEQAQAKGEAIDGTAAGEAAANLAINAFIGDGKPEAAIDSTTAPALDPPDDGTEAE